MTKKKTGVIAAVVAVVVVIALVVVSMNKFEYVTTISGGLYFDEDNAPDVDIVVHQNPVTGKVKFSVTSGKYSMGVIVSRELAIETLDKTFGDVKRYDGASRSWISEYSDTTWRDNDNFRNSSLGGYPTFTSDFIVDEEGAIFIFDPEETYKALEEI